MFIDTDTIRESFFDRALHRLRRLFVPSARGLTPLEYGQAKELRRLRVAIADRDGVIAALKDDVAALGSRNKLAEMGIRDFADLHETLRLKMAALQARCAREEAEWTRPAPQRQRLTDSVGYSEPRAAEPLLSTLR